LLATLFGAPQIQMPPVCGFVTQAQLKEALAMQLFFFNNHSNGFSV